MSDVIEEAGRVKAGTAAYDDLKRAQARAEEWIGDVPDWRDQLRDVLEMLCAPLGPTYDHDAWRRKQKREGK